MSLPRPEALLAPPQPAHRPGPTHSDQEGLAVEQVGELVQSLLHHRPPRLWDVQPARDHHILVAVLGGQEEDAVGVGLVVQHGDACLVHIVGLVLHLDHQVWGEVRVRRPSRQPPATPPTSASPDAASFKVVLPCVPVPKTCPWGPRGLGSPKTPPAPARWPYL